MPLLLRKLPLSLPWRPSARPWIGLPALAHFLFCGEITGRLLEFVLIIAIMGTSLKIDRCFAWRRWASAWRPLAIVMPLSIAGIAATGYGLLGLIGAPVLMGGMLAPTDHVLASEVEVGPPGSGEEHWRLLTSGYPA